MNRDIIKKYKSKKLISNLWIIAMSLALAISINFVISDTKLGNSLKTNLQESNKIANTSSDLYMEVEKNWTNRIVHIKTSKDIKSAKNIWISFFYNSSTVNIKDIVPDIENMDLLKLVDTNWSKTLSLSSSAEKNIKAWDSIATIFLEKNTDKLENLNLINTNFTDSKNNSYYLTTAWIDF